MAEPLRNATTRDDHQGMREFCPSRFDPESSAALRDWLVHEIKGLSSAEAGAEWARQALPAKNTLIASHARLVQLAFELRLSTLDGASKENAPQTTRTADLESRGTAEPAAPSLSVQEHSTAIVEPVAHDSVGATPGRIDTAG